MRPMDHMDYEEDETYKTYGDLLYILKSLLNLKDKQTQKLTMSQRITLLDWLKSFNGMPITIKRADGSATDELPTDKNGISGTFAILAGDLIYGMGDGVNPSFQFNDSPPTELPEKQKPVFDIDDYLDALAKISKPYVPKEVKVTISPVPANIDEALIFLQGLS